MTQQTKTEPIDEGPLNAPHVRLLKIAVVVMGLMIVAGVATVIGRIIYLASTQGRQGAVATIARPAPQVRLAVPPGAIVRQVSLSGDRVAVHYETAAGSGVAIVDIATGAVVSRMDIVPDLPK